MWDESKIDKSEKEHRRQILNPHDHGKDETQLDKDGKATIHTGLDVRMNKDSKKRMRGGFGLEYSGPKAMQVTFMQFLSITMAQEGLKHDKWVDGGDSRVRFTTDLGNRIYGVDYHDSYKSTYAPSYKSEARSMMMDDPTPCPELRKLLDEGATKVVETDQFDTFICIDGKPVFQMTLEVAFTSERKDESSVCPVFKTQNIKQAGKVTEIPEAFTLAIKKDEERIESNEKGKQKE
jgi:hypothetical protein